MVKLYDNILEKKYEMLRYIKIGQCTKRNMKNKIFSQILNEYMEKMEKV